MRLLISVPLCFMMMIGEANADDRGLTVFAAGSLREALGAIGQEFGAAHKLQIRTEFGPSGRMRERIEHGDPADLFASADLGHARKLVNDGLAIAMAMFARNSICVLAPDRLGLVEATIVQTLVDPKTRIGISTPKADPLGDYTVELYGRLDRLHPGAAKDLMARSSIIEAAPAGSPPRSGDAFTDALQEGRIDLAVLYCSGHDRYARLMPTAAMIPVPPDLQVGPEYALAVLKAADPMALQFALYVLSPEGQALLAQSGFIPVALPKAER